MSEPEFIDPSQIRSGPIRHESLPPELLEQIKAVYDVLGRYLKRSLEQFEISFMRDADPASEVGIWLGITAVWLDYHEKYLDDAVMSDADEQKLLSAMIAISTGVEDPAKLNVPVKTGKRLLECYDRVAAEWGELADEKPDDEDPDKDLRDREH